MNMDGANEKVVRCNLQSRDRVLRPNIVRSTSAQRGSSKTRKEFRAELTACIHYCINVNPTYRYVLLFLCFLVLQYIKCIFFNL